MLALASEDAMPAYLCSSAAAVMASQLLHVCIEGQGGRGGAACPCVYKFGAFAYILRA
jgi:hypothetical protein